MNDVRKKWILTAILAVIEILMTVTDLGYFVIGSSAFTVLHIPVFIAVILAGLPQGFLIAGIFGLSSMINAYVFNDSLLGYLFQDPRISVVPRLMIPFAVWLAYKVICYIADDHTLSARLICSGFAAVDGVIANAVFVIFSIAILDPEAIGITDSLSTSTIVVTNIIAINIFCEIIAAVAVTSLTVLILHRIGWLGLARTARRKQPRAKQPRARPHMQAAKQQARTPPLLRQARAAKRRRSSASRSRRRSGSGSSCSWCSQPFSCSSSCIICSPSRTGRMRKIS